MLTQKLDPAPRESPMLVEYVLGGVVTAALLVYLTYALLRPEKF
jgi:K+-transporting ATPase ATPase F chain